MAEPVGCGKNCRYFLESRIDIYHALRKGVAVECAGDAIAQARVWGVGGDDTGIRGKVCGSGKIQNSISRVQRRHDVDRRHTLRFANGFEVPEYERVVLNDRAAC